MVAARDAAEYAGARVARDPTSRRVRAGDRDRSRAVRRYQQWRSFLVSRAFYFPLSLRHTPVSSWSSPLRTAVESSADAPNLTLWERNSLQH